MQNSLAIEFEQDSASGLSVQSFVELARRWWKIALSAGILLGLIAAGLGYALWSPRYEATAWMKVDPTFIWKTEHFDILQFSKSQIELFKSPAVLDPALETAEVKALIAKYGINDPLSWVRKRLTTSTIGESQVFVVTVTCEYQDVPAIVANAIVDSYLSFTSNESDKQVAMRLDELKSNRDRLGDEIAKLEGNIAELYRKANIPGGGRGRAEIVLGGDIAALSLQKASAEQELARLNAVLGAKRRQIKTGETNNSLSVEELRSRIAKRSGDIDTIRFEMRDMPPNSSRRAEAAKQINAIEQEVSQLRDAIEARNINDEIKEIDEQHRQQSLVLDGLNKRLETRIAQADANQGTLAQIVINERAVEGKQQILNSLTTEIVKAEMERNIQRVRKMKSAQPPKNRVEDGGPARRALLSGLFGFLLPSMLIWLREYFYPPISTSTDLARAVKVPHVTEIVRLPQTRESKRSSEGPFGYSCEYQDSVDYLRVSLLSVHDSERPRIVAITSGEEGEGKSTLAANLAKSLAESYAGRVLLVDGDLRRPSLHRMLGMTGSRGLSECLVGFGDVYDYVQTTSVERLDFLGSGSADVSPATLLADDRFKRFAEFVREKFEFVIVDTPPLLQFSDGLQIARGCDGAVLCALRDRSQISMISKTKDRLKSAGVRILAAVLNGASPSRSTAGYYRLERSRTNRAHGTRLVDSPGRSSVS